MSEESWRPIQSAPFFEVSDRGRIRSLPRTIVYAVGAGPVRKRKIKGRVLAKFSVIGDYERISIRTASGRKKTQKVHRLVAMAFVPNPANKPCIDHINGDRADNRASNLRWVTLSENGGAYNWEPRRKRDLPRGILRNKGRGAPFIVSVMKNRRHINASAKTLRAAIIIRNKILRKLGVLSAP